MKLVKLSLAAVVAAGSFSFANAVALEDAIKNVDASGMMRYRYDTARTKEGDVKFGNQKHNFKAKLKLKMDIAENFKATTLFDYAANDGSDHKVEGANTSGSVVIKDAYLTYTYEDFATSIDFGRQQVNTIFTDDMYGTGLSITNKSVDGLTLRAFAFDNNNKDGDANAALIGARSNNNYYGVSAAFDADVAAVEASALYYDKVGTFYAIDANGNIAIDDNTKINIHAQIAGNAIDSKAKNALNPVASDNGLFYGLEAGVDVAGFNGTLGFAAWGKKDKVTMVTIEDTGGLLNYGEFAMDGYTGDMGERMYIFGDFGYSLDNLSFGLEAIMGTVKADSKTEWMEFKPKVSYKYDKKLSFSAWYAFADEKPKAEGADKITHQKIRLEAKYKF